VTVPSVVLAAAFAVSCGSFASLRLRLGRRLRAPFAPPRASAAAGVRYAFTTAFLPWAKESARRHLPSYAAGIVFHLGLFAGLARLVSSLWEGAWPAWADRGLAAVLGAALACGLGLLVKRHRDTVLRAVSTPEDSAASLLVNLFLAIGCATALRPALLPVFQLAGAALLLYAPLGKLRHLLFLLTSRRYWGIYFGRRGVRPAPRRAGSVGG
jgi:hypothetical protein